MNNHKSEIIIENEIEYHSLKFDSIDKHDVKVIEKFIKNYKYVKIIHNNSCGLSGISYYKNNSIHNDFGPSIIKTSKNGEIKTEYYLDGVELNYEKWKNKFRNYKLLKLKNL